MTADAIRFWTRAAALTAIASLVVAIAFPSFMYAGQEPFPVDDATWLIIIAVSMASAVGVLWHAPDEPRWIVPFQSQPIYGVAGHRGSDAVDVLLCVYCDWDLWFRWNGDHYESNLYAVGETVAIVDRDRDVPTPLFRTPNDARPFATVPGCTEAVVRRVSGYPGARWYEVEVPHVTGLAWVPARLTEADRCLG